MKGKSWCIPLTTIVIYLFFNQFLSAQPNEVDLLLQAQKRFVSLAEKIIPCVVQIQVEREHDTDQSKPMLPPIPPPITQKIPSITIEQGSGFIISDDGYILTIHSLSVDSKEISVILSNGHSYKAKVIGSDKDSQVSLLKIDGENFPYIKFGNSEHLKVGEWILVFGFDYPYNFKANVHFGIINALNLGSLRIAKYADFIGTDIVTAPKNYGSPLVNINGEVVGMTMTFTTMYPEGPITSCLAIPSNILTTVKDRLLSYGKMEYSRIGIQIRDVNQKDVKTSNNLKDLSGVFVLSVISNSPAEKGGVKENDIILRIDDWQVGNTQSLVNKIGFLQPGTEIKLTVLRNEKVIALNIAVDVLEGE
jgi:serine protease Do